MSDSDSDSLFTKIILLLVALVLVVGFGLFNVGLTVSYLIKSYLWAGMPTGWFWGLTVIFSLAIFSGFFALTRAGAEAGKIEGTEVLAAEENNKDGNKEQSRPLLLAGIGYLAVNFGLLIMEVIFYFMAEGNLLGNIFLTAFPFLQDSPLFQ